MKKSDIYSTYIAAIYICHRSISASTMIKTSVFYLQPVLSIQPVTVSVSAPVILSVLRDGEQNDRYRKSYKNGHRQPAGFMPHDPGFIPRIHSIRAP